MLITEYLKSLGHTAEEVAASLRAQGVKGKRFDHCYCSIVNGIYKACPNYWAGLEIAKGGCINGKWNYVATLNDSQIMDPTLPEPVMQFIGEFDMGKYPDLEAKTVKEVKSRVWE